MIWSVSGIVFEVPSGVLADHFSRRSCLIAAGFIQAGGYLLWIHLPQFGGFAVGFLLWSFAGSLTSGAFEALVYDGLAELGAAAAYPQVLARITAVELIAQVPAALLATWLFVLDGYRLVGWASVGVCLLGSVIAAGFTEPTRRRPPDGSVEDIREAGEPGYFRTLGAGLRQSCHPALRRILLAAAVLGGIDAIEEYFPLLAEEWGVPVGLIPAALLVIPLAGAIGALLGGRHGRIPPAALSAGLGLGLTCLAVGGVVGTPVAITGVAVFYGLYRWTLVVVEAQLQARITGTHRATVTSVAALGIELSGLVLFLLWAAGGLAAVVAMGVVITLALPWMLGRRTRSTS